MTQHVQCHTSFGFIVTKLMLDIYFFLFSIEYAAISIFDFLGTIDALSVILSMWN